MSDQFYTEIFKHSGRSYHQAMQLVPNARDQEFTTTVKLLNSKKNDTVLDVPAGGGYLNNYLANNIEYLARDFSTGFVDKTIISGCTESDFNVPKNSVDKIVCLAALHHIEDQLGFFEAAQNSLKNNGLLLVGDVIEGSAQDYFLNRFVNDWNSLGHRGRFINENELSKILTTAGFKSNYLTKLFTWSFESKKQAREYVRLLFNLDKKPSDDLIDEAIHALGTHESESSFQINWALGFFLSMKL